MPPLGDEIAFGPGAVVSRGLTFFDHVHEPRIALEDVAMRPV